MSTTFQVHDVVRVNRKAFTVVAVKAEGGRQKLQVAPAGGDYLARTATSWVWADYATLLRTARQQTDAELRYLRLATVAVEQAHALLDLAGAPRLF